MMIAYTLNIEFVLNIQYTKYVLSMECKSIDPFHPLIGLPTL